MLFELFAMILASTTILSLLSTAIIEADGKIGMSSHPIRDFFAAIFAE